MTLHLSKSKNINLIDELALATSITSLAVAMDGLYSWSLGLVFNTGTGTLVGSLAVQVTNGERGNPDHPDHANAVWTDISGRITSGSLSITSGAGSDISFVEGAPVSYMRVVFTHSGGTGVLRVALAGAYAYTGGVGPQ